MRLPVSKTAFCSSVISSSSLLTRNFFSSTSDSRFLNPVSDSIIALFRRSAPSIISDSRVFWSSTWFINKLTSRSTNSSLYSRYCLAVWDCSSKGSSCNANSDIISWIRTRFFSVSSSFLAACSLRDLYLIMPATSSIITLRSSDLALRISSIFPCPIME